MCVKFQISNSILIDCNRLINKQRRLNVMKKLITAMLALSLVLLVGCGGEKAAADGDGDAGDAGGQDAG